MLFFIYYAFLINYYAFYFIPSYGGFSPLNFEINGEFFPKNYTFSLKQWENFPIDTMGIFAKKISKIENVSIGGDKK